MHSVWSVNTSSTIQKNKRTCCEDGILSQYMGTLGSVIEDMTTHMFRLYNFRSDWRRGKVLNYVLKLCPESRDAQERKFIFLNCNCFLAAAAGNRTTRGLIAQQMRAMTSICIIAECTPQLEANIPCRLTFSLVFRMCIYDWTCKIEKRFKIWNYFSTNLWVLKQLLTCCNADGLHLPIIILIKRY